MIKIKQKIEIFTGKASAIEACQIRAINKNKALKENVNLKIPPSILFLFVLYDGIQ